MTAILLIARRELASYLRSWTGWIIVALVLFADGLLFNGFVLGGEKKSAEVVSQFFWVASGITMIASIFISMRLLAEERQSGTIALLYSSPVRDVEIVLGKYLSAVVLLGIITLATGYLPALVMVHGKVSFGHLAGGYLGLMLLGSAALAIGTLGSAVAGSQILAAILSGVMVASMVVLWTLARVTERPLSEIFTALSFHSSHFQPFQAGIVHLRNVVYYAAVIYVALFAATRVVEARRWR